MPHWWFCEDIGTPKHRVMLGLASCEPGHFSSLDPVFPGFVITFVGFLRNCGNICELFGPNPPQSFMINLIYLH